MQEINKIALIGGGVKENAPQILSSIASSVC